MIAISAVNDRVALQALADGRIRVDDAGRIWRVARPARRSAGTVCPIKPRRIDFLTANGYRRITIGNFFVQAHRVVWMSLHGAIPDGLVINHRNGVREDNRPSNLEAVSQKANVRHAIDVLGVASTFVRGEMVINAKLNAETVNAIRARVAKGERQKDIAKDLQLATSTISRIVTGQSWRHLLESSS